MDYLTLIYSLVLILITFGVVFLVVSGYRMTFVLRLFGIAYILMAFGYFSQSFQNATNFGIWFGVLFFNSIVGFATLMINYAIRCFFQKSKIPTSFYIVLSVYLFLLLVFSFFYQSFVIRIMISSFFIGLVMADIAYFLVTNSKWKATRIRYVFAFFSLLTVIAAFTRMLYVIMNVDISVVVLPDTITNVVATSFNLVMFSVWASLVLVVVHSIIQKELTEKNKILETVANIDTLTGLLNRNSLEREMDHLVKLYIQNNQPLSLILVDIDHFKNVNDNYGHPIGDLVLKQLANILTHCTQTSGKIYRWGGEEFLILAMLDITQAIELAEGIRHEVMNAKFDVDHQITISAGVADYNPLESYRSWFQHVDFALYQAKYSGRNLVKAHSNSTSSSSQYQSIVWNPEWNSKHPGIDKQHQQLVFLANQLLAFNPLGTPKEELETIVIQIYEELQDHFDYEERVLTQLNYLETMEHKMIHKNLLKEIETVLYKVRAGSYRSIHLFNVIVGKVIVGHLLMEDSKFFSLTKTQTTSVKE